jgi:sugar phosphate isomerase/epimerase
MSFGLQELGDGAYSLLTPSHGNGSFHRTTAECSTMTILSMNEVTTFRWPFEEDVARYVAAGYQGIGVWRQKLADYGEERGIDLLASSGLKVTNLLWAGGFTGSDGRSLHESVEDARHAIRLAGAMGAGCLVVYSGGRNYHTERHAERLLRTAVDQLLDDAVMSDVTLALEPMHPACAREWTFLSDLESTLTFCETFACPHLKLVLDAYHFGDDETVLANLRELVDYVGIVHLGDRKELPSIDLDRCCLGAGEVRLARFVHGLLEAGYQGDFDVELFGREIEVADYQWLLDESLKYLEELLAPVKEGG